jgi:signal transduction histidine kinase
MPDKYSEIVKVVLVSISIWLLISVVAGLGLVADAVHRQPGANWLQPLLLAGSVYMLYSVATPFIYFFVKNRLTIPLQPLRMGMDYLGVLVLFFALYIPASAIMYMNFGQNHAQSIAESISQHSVAYLVIDAFMLTALFIACCAIVYYRKADERARRFKQLEAEQENLKNRMFELQAQSLRGQLEPHFLFNALNAISLLIRKNETSLGLEAIFVLSNLLRRMIELTDERLVTVEDEMAFSKSYLALQKLRFESRIKDTWEIPENLMTKMMPPMLIQPLLENAIHHGVEPADSEVGIAVRLESSDTRLVLTVINDMSAEKRETGGTGNGLLLMEERLKLLYGKDYSLRNFTENGRFFAQVGLGEVTPE